MKNVERRFASHVPSLGALLVAVLMFCARNVWASEFRISTEPAPSRFIQESPVLYTRKAGGFYVVWKDYRTGEPSFFAQRYSSAGKALGRNFQVVGNAAFASWADGTDVLLGTRRSLGKDSVFVVAQVIGADGSVVRTFPVLELSRSEALSQPDVYLAGRDSDAVWAVVSDESVRLGTLEPSGVVQVFPIQWPIERGRTSPLCLAALPRGPFVMAWAAETGRGWSILASFFDGSGGAVREDVVVSTQDTEWWTGDPRQNVLRIASLPPAGGFGFLWANTRAAAVAYRIFFEDGSALGDADTLAWPRGGPGAQTETRNLLLSPPGAAGFSGLVTLVEHVDVPTVLDDLLLFDNFLLGFDATGLARSPAFRSEAELPDFGGELAGVGEGTHLAAFNARNDIYLGELRGLHLVDSVRVNDDSVGSNQTRPRVFASDSGHFLVTWRDELGTRARVLSEKGEPLGEEFSLPSQTLVLFPARKRALCFYPERISPGEVVAAAVLFETERWRELKRIEVRSLGRHAGVDYAVPLSDSEAVVVEATGRASGTVVSFTGEERRHSELPEYVLWPEAVLAGEGATFWVAWNGGVQLFDNRLCPVTKLYRLGGDVLAYLGHGFFGVELPRSPDEEPPRVAVLDTAGVMHGEPFAVQPPPLYRDFRVLPLDADKYLIAWADGCSVHAVVRDVRHPEFCDTLALHDHTPAYRRQVEVARSGNSLLFVWSDSRNEGSGYDVYGRLVPIGDVTGVRNTRVAPGSRSVLAIDLQCYPNPSNSGIWFRCWVGSPARAVLEVFNLRGQTVGTWNLTLASPGAQAVRWDATDDTGRPLPSGVYLVRLEAGGQVAVRKVVLVR